MASLPPISLQKIEEKKVDSSGCLGRLGPFANPQVTYLAKLLKNCALENKEPSFLKNKTLKIIENVHQDDIHCLFMLQNNHSIISGSKDGSLKQWDLNGNWMRDVYLPKQINYTSWITAGTPLGEDKWLSGTRDGWIHLWSREGKELLQIDTSPFFRQAHKCKQRNWCRVNCLKEFSLGNKDLQFFAGWPTQFTYHKGETFQRAAYCLTSPNDWVYAIHPLNRRSFLVVTGGRLDAWTSEEEYKRWKQDVLIQEKQQKNQPRHTSFISAITPLNYHPSYFGLSTFSGSIIVYDVVAKKIIWEPAEHKKRVWTVENISESCFASCADDGLIKLWDIRQQKQAYASLGKPNSGARVSVLLKTDNSTLLSGSCPDDVQNSSHKAQFTFWDLRI